MDILYTGVLLLYASSSPYALERELVLGVDIDNPDWSTKELCEKGMESSAHDLVKTFDLKLEEKGVVERIFWTTVT